VSDVPADQELEALRTLTGEVAHDLSNSLQIILGQASVLEDRLASTPEARHLASLNAAVAEAIRLTHKLTALGLGR
jgi:signal transduction histidine kinase